MDTKKALLTIIIVLAFALIATSLGQLTGYTTEITPLTKVTVNPSSIASGEVSNRYIIITVEPGQKIKDTLKIFKDDVRLAVKELDDPNCGGFCQKGETSSLKYWVSRTDAPGRYIVRVYDPQDNVAGTGYYEII